MATAVVLARRSVPERVRLIADSGAVGGTQGTGCRQRFCMLCSRGRRPPCLLRLLRTARHLCHTLSESDEGPPVAVLLIEMDTASWYRWFASAGARRTLHPLPGIPGHHLDHGRGTDQGYCWEPQTWMTARGIRSGSSGN
jgi:hypothetical protein